MSTHFAAVDLGATSGRVVLGSFGDGGFQLQQMHRFANTPITIDGVQCWDVDTLFRETLDGLALAVTAVTGMGGTLAGIAVDSWGVDYGLVDTNHQLIAPVRHYRTALPTVITDANQAVSPREAYARTGICELAINTCFQLIRDARTGLLTDQVTALLIPDLWTAWLSGVEGAERTIASTTGLLDWHTGDWATDLMQRWGIPHTVMAPVAETGSLAGMTLPAVTERIGSPQPIPVYRTGGHDTSSAFAAVTTSDEDTAVISCGTWALVGAVNPSPALSPEAEALGFTNEVAADGSALVIRNLSGTWLLDECVRTWAQQDGRDDATDLRQELTSAAMAEDAADLGLIDCGAPELISTSNVLRELTALHTREHGSQGLTRAQLVRVILESLAASFARAIADTARVIDRPLTEVIMIGGGSRLTPLVSLTAEYVGMPVKVQYQEATSIGSMCIQAASAGLFADVTAARTFIERTWKEAEHG